MTNADPTSTDSTSLDSTSTDSTTERAQATDSQAPLIAVSEENLAALMRATSGAPEAEVQQPVETPVIEVKEAPSVEESVASARADVVEPSPAPLTAAKEHRSELLQAAATAPVKQREYPAPSLPVTAPIQVTLPKPQAIAVAPVVAPPPSRMRLLIGCAIGAVIMVVGLIWLWPKPHPAKATPAVVVAVTPQDNAPLKLIAEPLGSGLINVRWNAQSTAIMQARDGRLVITEHAKAPRIMALDAGQLKIGHLTYPTGAESIQFDLEVNDVSGAVAKESILALSSAAIATPQAAREQAANVKPQIIPQAEPAKAATAAPPIAQTPVEGAQASPAKARAFVPPPTPQKKAQSAIIDAPPALASAPVTPLGVNVPAALTPLAPPPSAAPKQIQVESTLQAANLLKKVVPVYPVLARSAGIQGIVKFTALIGKDGKIQNLKFISGPPPLVDAAKDAVSRWVYRPTLLNGQPVEVITQINVNFTISAAGQ
jgi:outer membrane biosynthesis protein TonB